MIGIPKAEEVLTKPMLGMYASKNNTCSENQGETEVIGKTWFKNMVQFSHQI